MRLLIVHPGSSFSTHDVYVGLTNALLARGHQVHTYNLDARIERSSSWLNYCWRKAGKPDPKPTHADVLYRAGVEALERALRFGVDGVLAISAMFLHPDVLVLMRRAGLRVGAVFTESPYDDEPQMGVAPLLDACWTNERTSVRKLRAINPNTFYLPAAYDADRHRKLDDVPSAEVPAHDVVFVGSGFRERIELLGQIDWDGIDLGLYGSWSSLSSRSKLRKHLRGGVVDNRYAVDLYRRAKVGLNLYRRSIGFGRNAPLIERAESLNPRAYELAACGAFQISDQRAEVVEVFGWSVPTFRKAAELEELIRHYIEDGRVRRSMAVAARASVAKHTFAARAAQLEAQIAQVWAEPIAKGA